MKLLGLLVLVGALYITWGLFGGDGVVVPEGVLIQVQKSLTEEIEELVAKSNPNAHQIEVTEFWSKVKGAKELEVHFKFQYLEKASDGETNVEKKGVAFLDQTSEKKFEQTWEAREVHLEGQKIEFKKGMVFTGKVN